MNPAEVERILVAGLPTIRIPQPTDRVFKDECMFSFDTPETETGLYVCLSTFWGLGKDYVEKYVDQTGGSIFLHIRRIKHKKEKPKESTEGPEKKVTRLAIGVEGGFDGGSGGVEYEIEEIYSVAVWPGLVNISLPNDKLPEKLLTVIAGVIAAESALRAAELEAMAGTWDGELRKTSRHADGLPQLDTGKKIPPTGWKCEAEGCTKTDNLWLNLTDGAILCGRKNFDGSGGNNHAVEHYARSKYPLSVKLGTITPDGKADVFSYDEDDMVVDPKLVQHLAHFGINVSQLEKTEKSMIEMEIDLNMKFYGEISALTESNKTLKPVRGPGITGIVNLGNSCYMNSLMQALFTIPEFQERFSKNAEKYFESATDPVNNFNAQMSKFCLGLMSGKYSKKVEEEDNSDAQIGIRPQTFKSLVGKGHPEFSTKKQQDAQEFFLHLINMLERNSVTEVNPAECFKFQVEDKVQCNASKCVKYSHRMEYCLPLPIPVEAAINTEDVKEYEKKKAEAFERKTTLTAEETVRYKIPFESCIEAFIAKETLDPFYSSATKGVTTASKFTRLATFPDYLVIQLKKFKMGSDWTPLKLDVSVDMPLELDLSALKAQGKQADEIELPEEEVPQPKLHKVLIDESVVSQLMEMGFHPNACKRAVISSGNAGTEIAMNWIMQHMDDPDINDPVIDCSKDPPSGPFVANAEAILTIQAMGFTPAQAKKALQSTENNVERAVDWIFSHPDELNSIVENANNVAGSHPQPNNSKPNVTDGPAKYKMLGFISHMGPSSNVGHYVAHIWKDNSWVLFNDNRVAASEKLPKDLGYLYFYKRA